MPRQRIIGFAIAAMVAFIVGTMIVAGLRLGGGSQSEASASFCATAQAQLTPDAATPGAAVPGQSSFGQQIPANCRQ